MQTIKLILKLIDGYKTYASSLAAVCAALALIFGGDYLAGVPALMAALQALLAVAAGTAVMSLRQAVAKIESDPRRTYRR